MLHVNVPRGTNKAHKDYLTMLKSAAFLYIFGVNEMLQVVQRP